MRRTDPFSPLSLLSAFFVGGVLLPLYPFLKQEDGFSQFWQFTFSDRLFAALLAILGYGVAVLCFAVAYAVVMRSGVYSVKSSSIVRCLGINGRRPPLSFYAIGAVATVGLLLTIHLQGGFQEALIAASDRTRAFAGMNFIILLQNAYLSIGLAWALMLTNRQSRMSGMSVGLFLAYVVTSMLIVALQGAKATIFVYVLALAVVWHYRVRRFSPWMLLLFGGGLFVLLIIYHVIKQEYLVAGHFTFTVYGDTFLSAFVRYLFLQFTGNMMQLQTMAVLMDAIPKKIPFEYGRTLLMIALIWIPSVLYPGKPLTAPGVFTMAFWPSAWLKDGTTLPPGFFGEMYMNFGWLGLVGGGLLAGYLYGRSYRAAIVRPDCDLTLGRHAIFISVLLHYFRGEAASVTVLFFTIYLPFWLTIKLSATRLLVARTAS